jgi:hypothetical protein
MNHIIPLLKIYERLITLYQYNEEDVIGYCGGLISSTQKYFDKFKILVGDNPVWGINGKLGRYFYLSENQFLEWKDNDRSHNSYVYIKTSRDAMKRLLEYLFVCLD